MQTPRVSILIPTHNGERDLERLLAALARQEFEGGIERLATDTASKDRSVERLEAAGFTVERIQPHEFRHGATRNALAARARGEFVVFFSQDADPEGADFLERLLAPLEDARLAGVCARVLPHEHDDALTRRSVLAAREASARPLPELAAAQAFHNVAAAYRAKALREVPFPEVAFGEDSAWAQAALAAGWSVGFAHECVVRHAHRYTLRAAFERYRVDAAFRRVQHRVRIRPNLYSIVRGFAHECARDAAFVRDHGGWLALLRSPFLRGAQVLGQYWGSRGWRNPFPGAEPTREMI